MKNVTIGLKKNTKIYYYKYFMKMAAKGLKYLFEFDYI